VLLSTSLSAVEYGQLAPDTPNDTISLNAGDIFEPLAYSHSAHGTILNFKNGEKYSNGNDVSLDLSVTFSSYNYSGEKDDFTLVGPGIVTAYRVVHYKITRASEIEYKQVNIVSLPLDDVGNGTHNIVVEASDDLQSWTPVHSSSIGGDKAFFRTRVVEAE
tara:strand:+ start:120 stop:602 length:483 start_codon:yes stop_codon:yes gene_type:complete